MTAVLNMTTDTLAGMQTFSSWFSLVVLIGIITIILSFFIILLSNIAGFRKIKRMLQIIGNSFRYFGWGVLFIILLAVPSVIIYYFEKEAIQGNYIPIKYLGYIIGGYLGISLLGYFFKKFIVDRIKKFQKQDKKFCKEV